MSDFLTNLLNRSLGASAALRPRLPGRFEAQGSPANAVPGEPLAPPANAAPVSRAPATEAPNAHTSEPHHTAAPEHVQKLLVPPDPTRPREAAASKAPPAPEGPRAHAQPTPEIVARVERMLEQPGAEPRPRDKAPAQLAQEGGERETVTAPPDAPGESRAVQPAREAVAPAPPIPTPIAPQVRVAQPPAEPRLAEAAPASAAPRISVTIGRIDVRAVAPPLPAARSRLARPAPALSLDDYLKRREGGNR